MARSRSAQRARIGDMAETAERTCAAAGQAGGRRAHDSSPSVPRRWKDRGVRSADRDRGPPGGAEGSARAPGPDRNLDSVPDRLGMPAMDVRPDGGGPRDAALAGRPPDAAPRDGSRGRPRRDRRVHGRGRARRRLARGGLLRTVSGRGVRDARAGSLVLGARGRRVRVAPPRPPPPRRLGRGGAFAAAIVGSRPMVVYDRPGAGSSRLVRLNRSPFGASDALPDAYGLHAADLAAWRNARRAAALARARA